MSHRIYHNWQGADVPCDIYTDFEYKIVDGELSITGLGGTRSLTNCIEKATAFINDIEGSSFDEARFFSGGEWCYYRVSTNEFYTEKCVEEVKNES